MFFVSVWRLVMNKSENIRNTAVATVAGYATYNTTKKLAKESLKPYSNWVHKGLRRYTKDEKALLQSVMNDTFNNSGLASKGVKLIDTTPQNIKQIKTEFAKKISEITDNFVKKIYPKYKNSEKTHKLKNKKLDKAFKLTSKGQNAFYHFFTNNVYVNKKKLPSAVFHELGHALNHNSKGLSKMLSVSRHVMTPIVPLILAIGVLKRKKNEGEKPVGFMDKVTTFVKDNVGKLAFIALVPQISEEALASVKGAKLAKKVLSPELFKKVNKGNFRAWTTYLVGSLITVGAIKLATHVSDKVRQK